jgi:hypothetical protein
VVHRNALHRTHQTHLIGISDGIPNGQMTGTLQP